MPPLGIPYQSLNVYCFSLDGDRVTSLSNGRPAPTEGGGIQLRVLGLKAMGK